MSSPEEIEDLRFFRSVLNQGWGVNENGERADPKKTRDEVIYGDLD